MTWTPEMTEQVRKAADQILKDGNPGRAFILHQMAGTIEAQQRELEAAQTEIYARRALRDHYCRYCSSSPRLPCNVNMGLLRDVQKAEDAYDTTRTGQGEGEEL